MSTSCYSFNFNKLSKYNFNFITLEEVIFLEYLLHHYQKETLHKVIYKRVENETGLKKSKQAKAILSLQEKGFVKIGNNESQNTYDIQFEKITSSLKQLLKTASRTAYNYYISFQLAKVTNSKPSKIKKRRYKKKSKNAPIVNQISLFE